MFGQFNTGYSWLVQFKKDLVSVGNIISGYIMLGHVRSS